MRYIFCFDYVLSAKGSHYYCIRMHYMEKFMGVEFKSYIGEKFRHIDFCAADCMSLPKLNEISKEWG